MDTRTSVLSITKEELSALPIVAYPGHIIVVNTAEQAKSAIATIRRFDVVGFDTETKPSFRKGRTNNVALIQIATEDVCYLFRINKFGLIDEMIDLFEDSGVTKVGLSLRDDYHMMHKSREFSHENFIDLQNFVKDYNIADCSLQKIYAILFGERISKSQRLSNWEAPVLTASQQEYASIDAWACLRIYTQLVSGSFNADDSPYIKSSVES